MHASNFSLAALALLHSGTTLLQMKEKERTRQNWWNDLDFALVSSHSTRTYRFDLSYNQFDCASVFILSFTSFSFQTSICIGSSIYLYTMACACRAYYFRYHSHCYLAARFRKISSFFVGIMSMYVSHHCHHMHILCVSVCVCAWVSKMTNVLFGGQY